MPFIVLDDDKTYYIRRLKEYENDKVFLILKGKLCIDKRLSYPAVL